MYALKINSPQVSTIYIVILRLELKNINIYQKPKMSENCPSTNKKRS